MEKDLKYFSDAMAPFKVLIVGGSITGLSLALMLEKHDIDFLVLEAYSDITPDNGGAIALMSGSFRILEQLGCYEPFHQKFKGGISQSIHFHKPNGEVFMEHDHVGDQSTERWVT